MAHAGGAIQNIKYSNSKEALDSSYAKGFRLIEIDICLTTDGALVLVHDWDKIFSTLFKNSSGIQTLQGFLSLKMKGKLTQLSFPHLANWMQLHPEVSILLDSKKDPVKTYKKIITEYPSLAHNLIPEVWSFSQYFSVLKMGYSKVVFEKGYYSDFLLINFFKTHPVTAISLPPNICNSKLPKELLNNNIKSYVYGVNDIKLMKQLFHLGVHAISTDFLEISEMQKYNPTSSHLA